MKVFDEWRVERNEAVLKVNYNGESLINESVNEMSELRKVPKFVLRKVPKFVFKANLQNRLLEVLMEEDDYVGIPFLIKKFQKKFQNNYSN